MSSLQIALLVVGILVVQVLIWIPILRWVRRRAIAAEATLRGELEGRGERIDIGPAHGLYGGGTGEYPRAKGNAVIALTEQRLHVRRLVGAPIEIERSTITGAREEKWFQGSYKGAPWVVLSLAGGYEVAFIVRDRGPWLAAFPARAAV